MSRLVVLASLLLAACASAPKPPELEAFERIRGTPLREAAAKRAPQMTSRSEELFAESVKAWENKDLYESRRDALMGSILLKTAVAIVEQDQANARIRAIDSEFTRSEEEYARLAKDLKGLQEQIALYEKLQDTKSEMAQKEAKLAEEQQRARANDKLSSAQLALKAADVFDAKTHAAPEYTAAKDLIERAQNEIKNNSFSAAVMSAETAKQKAELAATVAKPKYEAEAAALGDKARNEALARDATAIMGVTVRMERRGNVQRVVLPLQGLFARKSTAILPGMDSKLDPVAELLKKYPTYPVQVIGHTDNRGRYGELVALSQARAQSVYGGLMSRGIDGKRMTVSGMGPDQPIAPQKGSAREQNNRVEVILTY